MGSKAERSDRKSTLFGQLESYVVEALAGLIIFVVFVISSMLIELLSRAWAEVGMMIICKIVARMVSGMGAICCIALVVRNTIVFIKFLMKRDPEQGPGEEAAGEGRVK